MKQQEREGPRRGPSLLVCAALAVGIAWGVALLRGFGLSSPARVNYAACSDGFFLAGVLLGGVGLLVVVGSTGFFDMLSYGLQGLWHRIAPFLHPSGQKPFYEYKAERAGRRGSPPLFLLGTGAVCIAIAGLFLLLYSRAG